MVFQDYISFFFSIIMVGIILKTSVPLCKYLTLLNTLASFRCHDENGDGNAKVKVDVAVTLFVFIDSEKISHDATPKLCKHTFFFP